MGKNRVKELREEKLWSIRKLAREAGVSESVIAKMEAGEATTRISKLKVAKVLGKKLEQVFLGGGGGEK